MKCWCGEAHLLVGDFTPDYWRVIGLYHLEGKLQSRAERDLTTMEIRRTNVV